MTVYHVAKYLERSTAYIYIYIYIRYFPQICREQFVALHNEPILKDLAEFWELKFGGLK